MLRLVEQELRLPTPTDCLSTSFTCKFDCDLFIKRDDLIHPLICGNKWRKLKYNLAKASDQKNKIIVTFGGMYSNHLVAVAVAGFLIGIPTLAIIRSYKKDVNNPTIKILRDYNMKLEFVDPYVYKTKENHPKIQSILRIYPNHYLIPEGGSNTLAFRGVSEMMEEISNDNLDYSHILVGIGTGGTLAGIAKFLSDSAIKIIGVSPFKGPVNNIVGLHSLTKSEWRNVVIINSVPETRFGSFDNRIVSYIKKFYSETDILLDPIYTAKVMMTVESLLEKNYFAPGSRILIIHTGGIQGIKGYEYQYNCDLSIQ